MRPTPTGGTRLRRAPSPVVRSRALGAEVLARLLVRHRPRCRGDAAPGLRPSTHALRRARLARDVLHDRDGALANERDGHWMGADALARDAAGGVGCVDDG